MKNIDTTYYATRATRRRERWSAALGYAAALGSAAAYFVILWLAFCL